MYLDIKIEDITEDLLKKFISDDMKSNAKKTMIEADKYMGVENSKISGRRKMMQLVDEDNNPYIKDDFSKANNKARHAYLQELINQCTNFLAGKQMRIDYKKEVTDEVKEEIDDELYKKNNFVGFIQKNIDQLQLYGKTFMRIVKDEKGNNKFVTYDPKEMIMFYNEFEEPVLAIRYYTRVELVEDMGKKKPKEVKYAEVYNSSKKDTWKVNKKGKYEKTNTENVYANKVTFKDEKGDVLKEDINPIESPVFPIIEWRFNDLCIPTITAIKDFIDLQDTNLSDLANNVEDIQDAIWILENYNGQNLKEFMEDLKVKKAVKVGQGGNARPETVEIPIQAREKLYELCNKNIYKFGFGINFSDRENIGNVSGVALKWSYAPLEQKGNCIENNGQEPLNNFFNILFMLMGVDYDSNDLEFHFVRSMIANEQEITSTVMSASSQLSQKTILENLPMVKDVEEELNRLEEDTEYEPVPQETDETGEENEEEIIIGNKTAPNNDVNGDNKQ